MPPPHKKLAARVRNAISGYLLMSQLIRPYPHYAREIWKRRLHSENAANCFPTPLLKETWKCKNHQFLGFVLEEILDREITWLSWCHCFQKALFSKCFPSKLKRTVSVFKFLYFEELFRKAPFCNRLVHMSVGLTIEIKLLFQISPV